MGSEATPHYDPTDLSRANKEIAKRDMTVHSNPDEEQKQHAKEVLENFENGPNQPRPQGD